MTLPLWESETHYVWRAVIRRPGRPIRTVYEVYKNGVTAAEKVATFDDAQRAINDASARHRAAVSA